MADVRHFREQEPLRFWPGVWWRWILALEFVLAAVTRRSPNGMPRGSNRSGHEPT